MSVPSWSGRVRRASSRSRRRLALVAVTVAVGLLWQPVLYPAGKAALLLLDIYSPSLLGTNLAAIVTPEPREHETRERFAEIDMRVSWWRPGWGDRHPGLVIVNGATPLGNDNAATRQFAKSLARAGYLVMLPEFPFLKEGRLDPEGPRLADAAFAFLRALPETRGRPVGAFGASVGGGMILVAAGSGPSLSTSAYLAVLGGYFDVDTYVASVVVHVQILDGRVVPWRPSDEASERLPKALLEAMTDTADKDVVIDVLAARSYDAALARLRDISPRGREVLDRLSPSTVWASVAPPVFWIHDPADDFEPLGEAQAAQSAPRPGHMSLAVPRLLHHAEVAGDAGSRGPLFVIGELWSLLTFTLEVLRIAG
jgi:dienelactone hydrolase